MSAIIQMHILDKWKSKSWKISLHHPKLMATEYISDIFSSQIIRLGSHVIQYFLGPEMLTESQIIVLKSQIVWCSLGPIAAWGTVWWYIRLQIRNDTIYGLKEKLLGASVICQRCAPKHWKRQKWLMDFSWWGCQKKMFLETQISNTKSLRKEYYTNKEQVRAVEYQDKQDKNTYKLIFK